MKRASSIVAVGTAAALPIMFAACGSLDSNPNAAPALATVHGAIDNPQSIDVSGGASVRVAIVWGTDLPGQFDVAEDLPVQPMFPSAFTIELDGPPPASAMLSHAVSTVSGGGSAGSTSLTTTEDDASTGTLSKTVRFLDTPVGAGTLEDAYGTVVAYLDRNHNGKLDLVDESATAFVDEILATNIDTAIVYVQGTIPYMAGLTQQPIDGYQLYYVPSCWLTPAPHSASACPSSSPDAGSTGDGGPCPAPMLFPIDTPIVLTVSSSPEVSALMCADPAARGGGGGEGMGTGPNVSSAQPAKYPDPCDPNVSCSPDGSSYAYTTCTTASQGLCRGSGMDCTSLTYDRPTPVPAGWPCLN